MCIEQMIQRRSVVLCVVVVLDGVCLACGGMCMWYEYLIAYSSSESSNASSTTNISYEVTMTEVLQQ